MPSALNSILTRQWNQIRAARLARRANRLYAQGLYAEASAEYEASLELNGRNAVVHYNLGLSLYKLGRRLEARKQWERALVVCDPDNTYLKEQTNILLRQFN